MNCQATTMNYITVLHTFVVIWLGFLCPFTVVLYVMQHWSTGHCAYKDFKEALETWQEETWPNQHSSHRVNTCTFSLLKHHWITSHFVVNNTLYFTQVINCGKYLGDKNNFFSDSEAEYTDSFSFFCFKLISQPIWPHFYWLFWHTFVKYCK